MGSSKPLLRFDGRTALELVLGAAIEAGVGTSVIVAGRDARRVMEAHDFTSFGSKVRWAVNEEDGSEQLRSLQIGLSALRGDNYDGFFLHPVDHPLVTHDDYKLLLDAFVADRDEATVFILSHARRRGHPILCRASLAAKFLALSPSETARGVIERERIAYALTPNAHVLEDMDTPEDYSRLLKMFSVPLPAPVPERI